MSVGKSLVVVSTRATPFNHLMHIRRVDDGGPRKSGPSKRVLRLRRTTQKALDLSFTIRMLLVPAGAEPQYVVANVEITIWETAGRFRG
jgi:hypothetical protein